MSMFARVAELTSTGNIDQGHIVYYRASKSDCSGCALKPKCTTAVVRKITRDLNEDVRDRVRALANTEAFQQSRRERKKIESVAHIKRILKLDRLRLRGLNGVRDEVLLTATAQNLRRLTKLVCRSRHLWQSRVTSQAKTETADTTVPKGSAQNSKAKLVPRQKRVKLADLI